MGFLEFSKSQDLQENSLYTNQQEKDALLANKTALMNSFYLNFFGIVGLYSIFDLLYLKRYFAEEKKLFVSNITDENKDVSLIIKLLFDEKILQRSVVDRMTKLLVKIKSKQIKPAEIDEKIMRDLLTDMHYLSHRGSPQIMQVLQEFVSGTCNFKQATYRLYKLSKKKDFVSVASEFKDLGLRYAPRFKTSGADLPNGAAPVAAAPAAAPQPVPVASTAPAPTPAPAPTVVPVAPKVVHQAPQPKGKTAEFWLKLMNARGRVEFSRVGREFGVDVTEIRYAEYQSSAQTAANYGKVNLNDLAKSPSELLFGKSYGCYISVIQEYLARATDFSSLLNDFANIDDFSRIRIKDKFSMSIPKDSPFHTKLMKLVKEWLSQLTNPTSALFASREILNSAYELINAIGYTKIIQEFSLVEKIKLVRMFGDSLVTARDIKRIVMADAKINGDIWTEFTITKEALKAAYPNKEEFDAVMGFAEEMRMVVADASNIEEAIKTATNIDMLMKVFRTSIKPVFLTTGAPLQTIDPKLQAYIDKVLGVSVATLTPVGAEDLYKVKSVMDTVEEIVGTPKYKEYWQTLFDSWVTVGTHFIETTKKNDTSFIYAFIATFGQAKNDLAFLIWNSQHVKNRFIAVEESVIKAYRYYIINDTYRAERFLVVMNAFLTAKTETFAEEIFTDILNSQDYRKLTDYSLLQNIPNNQKFSKTLIDRLLDVFYAQGIYNFRSRISSTVLYKINPDQKEEVMQWVLDFMSRIPDIIVDAASNVMFILEQAPNLDIPDKLVNAMTLGQMSSMVSKVQKNEKTSKHFKKKFLEEINDTTKDSSSVFMNMGRNSQLIPAMDILTEDEDLTNDTLDNIVGSVISLLQPKTTHKWDRKNWTSVQKESYDFDLQVACTVFNRIGADMFKTQNGEKAVETIADILSKPTKIKKEYRESVITSISDLFTNADVNTHTEQAFSKFETRTKKLLAINFANAQFAGAAVDEINQGGVIKPRSVLPAKGALKVLKLNQVSIPTSTIDLRGKRGNISLAIIQDAAKNAAKSFQMEKQAVQEVMHSEEELEKLSVAYNKFNRYRHGGIAVKITKVFNVSLPKQNQGWQEYLDQWNGDSQYYYQKPQFHGTASLPASMILRYGFSVIDDKLARDAGIKYAGRMLGDGIYSSNVLDKVSQYINDDAPTGVSRKRGVVGYVFEMEAQGARWARTLSVAGSDFATAGGVMPGDRPGIISPEWAWKGANSQLRIFRCYEVLLINKHEMDALVNKHKNVAEAVEYKSFAEYLEEAKRPTSMTNQSFANFTFYDNMIPVGKRQYIDFDENQNVPLPKGARIDLGRHGVTIQIPYKEDVDARFVHGVDIEMDAAAKKLYFNLMGIK